MGHPGTWGLSNGWSHPSLIEMWATVIIAIERHLWKEFSGQVVNTLDPFCPCTVFNNCRGGASLDPLNDWPALVGAEGQLLSWGVVFKGPSSTSTHHVGFLFGCYRNDKI